MPPAKRHQKARTLDQAFRVVLKELREAKGWSQAELAATSGYRQSFISNIESGKQTPRITVIFDILESLGKRPDLYMRAVMKRVEQTLPAGKTRR
jgi:transcriptional regulator with XRE-family HTH domain